MIAHFFDRILFITYKANILWSYEELLLSKSLINSSPIKTDISNFKSSL